jgi:hypothetical protein
LEQKPEQHDEAEFAVQVAPFGWQAQTRLPEAFVVLVPWQHLLQESFLPFLPLGFLLG